jgi:hypothetical protein
MASRYKEQSISPIVVVAARLVPDNLLILDQVMEAARGSGLNAALGLSLARGDRVDCNASWRQATTRPKSGGGAHILGPDAVDDTHPRIYPAARGPVMTPDTPGRPATVWLRTFSASRELFACALRLTV